jgi:PAS domain S-box-containing protein
MSAPRNPPEPRSNTGGQTDQALECTIRLDARGRIEDVDPSFLQVTGWEKRDLLGRSWTELLDTPNPSPAIEPARSAGDLPPSGHGWCRRADGSPWAVLWELVRDADGTLQARFRPAPVTNGGIPTPGPSPDRARVILRSIGDAVLTTDATGCVEYLNPVAERLTGWSLAEARGRPIQEVFPIVNEETGQPVESPVNRVLREGIVVGLANHTILRSRDGREIPISDAGAPVRDETGNLIGVVLVFRDQTEERRWQRHRDAERDLLEWHARGEPVEEWLTRLCRAYESIHPGALCSVLLCEGDCLRSAAGPSLPEAYQRAIDGVRIGPNVGSCGTAAWRRERVIVSDIASSPLWQGWQDLAARFGLAACWSFPILNRRQQVLGTFAVYYREPRGPTDEEIETLERWAHLAGLVIEHQRVLDELRRSESRLAEAQARARLGSWELDLRSGHAEWSVEMARLHGWPESAPAPSFEEFLSLVHPSDQPRIRSIHQRLGLARAPFMVEYRTHPERGPVRHIQARIEVIRDAEGQPVRVVGTSLDITDRVRLEEQIRHREEQFRRLIEHAPEAVVLLDVASGRFVLANTAAQRLFRLTDREILQRGVIDLSPEFQPDGEPSAIKAHRYIATALAGETPVFEWTHRDAQGHEIPCEVRLLRMEFDGRVVVRGSILDISQRKAAEERIRRLTRAHALRSAASQLIVREQDDDALLAGVCRVAVEVGGLPGACILRMDPSTDECTVAAAAHPANTDAAAVTQACHQVTSWAALRDAIRQGRPWTTSLADPDRAAFAPEPNLPPGIRSVGCFPVHADEQARWALLAMADVPGYFDGETTRLFADLAADVGLALQTHRNERQRREAEERLRRSEERFRLLIENITDLITVVDRQAIVRYLSPSVRRVLGYDPDQLLGRSALELVHPEDVQVVLEGLDRAIQQPDLPPITVGFRLRDPQGNWHRFEAVGRFAPDLLPGGAVVVNLRDVTEMRQLEEQFRQAQKMEAVGRLAGGVAHDFNNILSVIMMQTELIRMSVPEETLPTEVTEGLDQIRLAAERAAALTRQLLMFSRKQVMQTRELDLNDVVATLVKMIQRIIGEDIQLQLRLDPDPLPVRADPGMLDQVLMNLVVNARDAMPGGGQLTLATDRRVVPSGSGPTPPDLPPGTYAVLRVRDTGVGIPEEHLSRIFEPFFTTKEPGKGTGLGLATVFGVAKQHGGTVTVSSEVGRGSTFEVWLPLLEKAIQPGAGPAVAPPPGGSETILLVEDDEPVRSLTRDVLESAGYRVLVARDGLEALALWQAKHEPVHLLFTDLVMPGGLGGRELAQKLRQQDPGLRVVFCTGYSAELAGRDLELGPGQALLEKPANPLEILQTVRRCLDAV